MFKRLYHWTLSLAESPRATWALGAIAFAESSFFPIPPDVILVPMSLARPKRAWFYAGVCTLASVAGGILGYAIGWLLWDSVGHWLIDLYGYTSRMDAVKAGYDQWGWLFILVKGLTPIPFKLVTIVSGLLHKFGGPIKGLLERHFATFMIAIVVMIVGGFWLAGKMF